MSGGGSGGSTQTTTQTADPWSGAQPYLRDVMGGAQGAYNSGKGFDYPNFPTTIPFANQTTQALQGIESRAGQGNPLGDAANSAAMGIFGNNGLLPYQQQAGQGYAGIAGGQQPSAVSDYLTPYARGDYVNGGSPQFLSALDYQSGQTADDVNRQFSNAGRYGSMSHGNELVDRIGQQRNSAMAGEIAREQGQQMQAGGLLSGEQQQGIGNRMAAYGGQAGVGGAGASQLGQFAGLAPSIYEQGFSPYSKMADVGSAYQDQATRQMQENVNRYDTTQQSPWARLAAYNGLIGGMGRLGSTSSTQVPAPSPLQGAISGGLMGGQLGSMFGPWGMGLGALGGGLLGGLF